MRPTRLEDYIGAAELRIPGCDARITIEMAQTNRARASRQPGDHPEDEPHPELFVLLRNVEGHFVDELHVLIQSEIVAETQSAHFEVVLLRFGIDEHRGVVPHQDLVHVAKGVVGPDGYGKVHPPAGLDVPILIDTALTAHSRVAAQEEAETAHVRLSIHVQLQSRRDDEAVAPDHPSVQDQVEFEMVGVEGREQQTDTIRPLPFGQRRAELPATEVVGRHRVGDPNAEQIGRREPPTALALAQAIVPKVRFEMREPAWLVGLERIDSQRRRRNAERQKD